MTFDPREFDTDEDVQDSLTVEDDGEGLSAEAGQQLAEALVAQTPAATAKDDEVDLSYLQDVDKRLEVSHCYRLLIKNPMFEDRTEASIIVEKEIRAFIRERMSSLLNLKGSGAPEVPKAESQFTDIEVKVLKVWAAAIQKKPSVIDSVNQQPSNKKPTVRKQTAGGIRPVAATKPAATPAPAGAPAPAPQAPAPQAKPTAPAGPAAAPAQGRRLRRPLRKQLTDADGNPVFYKDSGKPVMRDVTPQVRGSGGIPFPSDITTATAMKAQQAVMANDTLGLGSAIANGNIPVTSHDEEE